MKFSNECPPIFNKLHEAFGVEWGGNLCIAYADTIWHTQPLDPSVIVHESVHLQRQNGQSDEWFEKYIKDPKFRFGEEILAYREQYKFIQATRRDRNEIARLLFKLAGDLSSPMYGSIVGKAEAMKIIKAK